MKTIKFLGIAILLAGSAQFAPISAQETKSLWQAGKEGEQLAESAKQIKPCSEQEQTSAAKNLEMQQLLLLNEIVSHGCAAIDSKKARRVCEADGFSFARTLANPDQGRFDRNKAGLILKLCTEPKLEYQDFWDDNWHAQREACFRTTIARAQSTKLTKILDNFDRALKDNKVTSLLYRPRDEIFDEFVRDIATYEQPN